MIRTFFISMTIALALLSFAVGWLGYGDDYIWPLQDKEPPNCRKLVLHCGGGGVGCEYDKGNPGRRGKSYDWSGYGLVAKRGYGTVTVQNGSRTVSEAVCHREFSGPAWAFFVLAGVLAAYPLGAVFRGFFRRRRRRRQGVCVCCGYDLTGNVSGPCPECGAPVPSHASAHTGDGLD